MSSVRSSTALQCWRCAGAYCVGGLGRSSAAVWVSIEGQLRQPCPTIPIPIHHHRSTVAYSCTRNSTPCLARTTVARSTR